MSERLMGVIELLAWYMCFLSHEWIQVENLKHAHALKQDIKLFISISFEINWHRLGQRMFEILCDTQTCIDV